MKRSEPKLGFRNKNTQQVLDICGPIARALAQQSDALRKKVRADEFMRRHDELVQLKALAGELKAQLRATQAAMQKAEADTKRHATLTVQLLSGLLKSDAELLAMGVSLRKVPGPSVVPGPIESLRSKRGMQTGMVTLMFKHSLRRYVFEIERAEDPVNGPWEYLKTACGTRVRLTDQPRGQVWYRIRARNGKGEGPWSTPLLVEL